MNEYTVYMHINKQNNKRYIGITKQNPKIRCEACKRYGASCGTIGRACNGLRKTALKKH